MKRIKNIFLFLLAPFIALFYIAALPFVGMYFFINLSIEVIHNKYSKMKTAHDFKKHALFN